MSSRGSREPKRHDGQDDLTVSELNEHIKTVLDSIGAAAGPRQRELSNYKIYPPDTISFP
jgi:hypothetical protein